MYSIKELWSLLHQYTPIDYLVEPSHRSYWLYLFISAIMAWLVVEVGSGNSKARKAGFLASLKRLFGAQAKLDYTYFLVNWLVKTMCLAPILLSANTVAKWCTSQTHGTLYRIYIDYNLASWGTTKVAFVYTLCLFICNDASRYFLHRAMHKFDILWAFHKVHHSATELNPFTFFRVHPVENALFGLRYALVTGVITGLFLGVFRAKLSLLDIAGVNAFIYFFNIIGSNLRHSHIYLRYPKWLEYIFISPAQHQLHHQYKTSRKNYGSVLAIWDTLFHSLLTSNRHNKPHRFGLTNKEVTQYNNLAGLFLTPFRQLLIHMMASKNKKQFFLVAFTMLCGLLSPLSAQAQIDYKLTPKQELGKQLYFDNNLSKNRTQNCATCHEPDFAFIDPRSNVTSSKKGVASAVSSGDDGKSFGDRNAPSAAYANQSPKFMFDKKSKQFKGGQFLDGRASDLADQAGQPILNSVEMNMPSKQAVIQRIKQNPDYIKRFKAIYGPAAFKNDEIAYDHLSDAIGAFEQSDFFAPFDSKYDRFLRGEYELTLMEDLGRTLFFSNNNVSCGSCHLLKAEDAPREPFSNYEYHNIGVPKNPKLSLHVPSLRKGFDHGLLNNPKVSNKIYEGKFKVPSLRNVAVTAPYMHNGVFQDLETVVKFYDKFNNPKRTINPETGKPWGKAEVDHSISLEELKGKKLTQRKVDALVAFMKLLTDARYEHLIPPKEDQKK